MNAALVLTLLVSNVREIRYNVSVTVDGGGGCSRTLSNIQIMSNSNCTLTSVVVPLFSGVVITQPCDGDGGSITLTPQADEACGVYAYCEWEWYRNWVQDRNSNLQEAAVSTVKNPTNLSAGMYVAPSPTLVKICLT